MRKAIRSPRSLLPSNSSSPSNNSDEGQQGEEEIDDLLAKLHSQYVIPYSVVNDVPNSPNSSSYDYREIASPLNRPYNSPSRRNNARSSAASTVTSTPSRYYPTVKLTRESSTKLPQIVNDPILYCILAINLFSAIPCTLPAPFFPSYALKEYNIDSSGVGNIFGIYTIASFFAGFISFPLLRYYGRAKVLLLGGLVLSGGSLGFCYSNSYLIFALTSALEGFGCGMVSVALCSLTSVHFEENDLAFAFALVEAVLGIASAMGPGIGSVLYAYGGFQFPFIISVVLYIICTIVTTPVIAKAMKKRILTIKLSTNVDDQLNSSLISDKFLVEKSGMSVNTALFYAYKFFNWGFCLSSLNIVFACLVSAVTEPILEIHFYKYMSLTEYSLGQLFLWPAVLYSVWAVLFVYICRKFKLFEKNMFLIMGAGNLINGVGLLFLGPVPFFQVEKDSYNAWMSQIVGLFLINIGMGIGAVPSVPAMKKSIIDKGDVIDDIISSVQCVLHAFSRTVGCILGGYLNLYFGFEYTVTLLAVVLVFVSIPYFVYHIYLSILRNNHDNNSPYVKERAPSFASISSVNSVML